MARYNFSKTIVHSGLNKTKTIYGNSRYEIAYKEQIQIKQWEEQWQRKLQIELTKGQDVQYPTITAEQLADAMLDSVSGMEGATPEALEQLRNGLLGILQSAAEQENAHEADE